MARRGYWVYVGGRAGNKPPAGEKLAITSACERFIKEVLKPRFIKKTRRSKFNYPVDIYGKWHGNKYRFVTRFRSDDPHRRMSRSSMRLSRASNTFGGIISTCRITATQASGFLFSNMSP